MIKQQLISKDYQPLAKEIQHYFSQSNVVLQDDRNCIKKIIFKGQTLVVKSYGIPHWLNRFIYTYVKKSKVWRAYEYGLKISQFTPKVIARIEFFDKKMLTKSYLICEYFEPDFNMQAPLFKNHLDKNNIFKQFAKFVFDLHQSQILHQDLSPGNVLIKKTMQEYEFKIIDINRMVFKSLSVKQRAKNFSKLWANDNDLRTILETYAEVANLDEKFINLGLFYNQQNKDRKTRKRKIKQVLDL